MKFVGTNPWDTRSGGYEFELSEDGSLVHLHDTDLVGLSYDRAARVLTALFRYDPEYAPGVLRARPFLKVEFTGCDVLSWEDEFLLEGVVSPSGELDMSVKTFDFNGVDTLVLESGPVTLRFQAERVEVEAVHAA